LPTNLDRPAPRRKLARDILWGAVALLLLAPWVAMQLTDEMAWTPFDFALFSALVIGGAATYELAAWKVRDSRYRLAIGFAVAAVVLIIAADGAVGVF